MDTDRGAPPPLRACYVPLTRALLMVMPSAPTSPRTTCTPETPCHLGPGTICGEKGHRPIRHSVMPGSDYTNAPRFWHDCHCRQISSIRPEYELNYCLQQCRTTNGPLLRDILEEQLWGAWDVPLQPDEKSSISECFDTSYAVFQCRQIGWLSTL